MLFYPVFCKLPAADSGHGGNGIDKFAQQGRRSQFFVFADVAPDVGQVQDFARADEGFEEQVAVVIATGSVAFGGMFGNQVEYGGFGITGKISVVQTQQADDFKGQATHRYHTAKSDAAA